MKMMLPGDGSPPRSPQAIPKAQPRFFSILRSPIGSIGPYSIHVPGPKILGPNLKLKSNRCRARATEGMEQSGGGEALANHGVAVASPSSPVCFPYL